MSSKNVKKSSKQKEVQKKEEKSREVGRPTSYDPKYCQEMIDCLSQGYSITTFAVRIGVSKDTIYEWVKTHDEFSDAFRKAKDHEQSWYETTGRSAILGEIAGFNSPAYIFHMKNKFGWRDRPDDIKITHVLEEQKQLDKIDPNVIEGILLGREDEDDD